MVEDMNGYRTIKITAGMTQEFEIIWTNAPDHVIKAQLMYIAACEEKLQKEHMTMTVTMWN